MSLWSSSSLAVVDLSDDEHGVKILKTPKRSLGAEQTSSRGSRTINSNTVISHMAVSPDGQWLASCDVESTIYVFNLDSIKHHCTLPAFPFGVACLEFDISSSSLLYIGLVNNTIQVFNVEDRAFPDFARKICQGLPKRFTHLHDSIQGLCFEPADNSLPSTGEGGSQFVYAWSTSWICKLPLTTRGLPSPSAPQRKRDRDSQRIDPGDTETTNDSPAFDTLTRYKNVLCVDFLASRELVVVERPIIDVLRTLPPPYFKAKYGNS